MLLAACMALPVFTASTARAQDPAAPREVLAFDMGEEVWKLAFYHEAPNRYSIHEFVREGDSVADWKELLTIQNLPPLGTGRTPRQALEAIARNREQICPGRTAWNVIDEDNLSILYEWQTVRCANWPDQHEIAKIISGAHNVFFLHYARKTSSLEDGVRDRWVARFAAARIMTISPSDIPQGR